MLRGSYHNGFAPRDGMPMYPSLWQGCVFAVAPCLGSTGQNIRDWAPWKYHADTFGGTGTTFDADAGQYCCTLDGNGRVYTSQTVAHGVAANDFTICMWVKPAAITNAWKCVWSNGTGNAPALYSTLQNGTANWGIYWSGNRSSGVVLAASIWQHLVVRRTGGLIEYFTNGVKSGTSVSLATSMSNAVFIFGSEVTASQQAAYTGGWDDFRFYNRSLPDGLITRLASRRGIAYDLAPMRIPYSEQAVSGAARLRRILLGME